MVHGLDLAWRVWPVPTPLQLRCYQGWAVRSGAGVRQFPAAFVPLLLLPTLWVLVRHRLGGFSGILAAGDFVCAHTTERQLRVAPTQLLPPSAPWSLDVHECSFEPVGSFIEARHLQTTSALLPFLSQPSPSHACSFHLVGSCIGARQLPAVPVPQRWGEEGKGGVRRRGNSTDAVCRCLVPAQLPVVWKL